MGILYPVLLIRGALHFYGIYLEWQENHLRFMGVRKQLRALLLKIITADKIVGFLQVLQKLAILP
jgi:hypothetical protein